MYLWIWIQSVLRELWLPGYTVLIPLRWKLDLDWQRNLGSLRHNSGSNWFTGYSDITQKMGLCLDGRRSARSP